MGCRRAGATALAVLLGALLVPLTATPAYACSCAGLSLRDQVKLADAVFVGTITNREPRDVGIVGAGSGMDEVIYSVAVREVYEGSVAEIQRVASVADGASCGLEVELGHTYVFFPRLAPAAGAFQADELVGSLCDGTTKATAEVEQRLQAALGPPFHPRPAAPEPSSPPALTGIRLGELLFFLVFGCLFGASG